MLDEKFAAPWINLGNLLQNHLQRYEEAEAAYRRAIALDEKFAAPWINLGYLLQNHLQRYEEAEATYRRAIALDDKDAMPWNNLGNLLLDHLQRYEEAEAAYRRAIALDRQYAFLWVRVGNLLQDYLGQYDDALKAYQAQPEIDPKDPISLANIAYLQALHLEDLEEAVRCANSAMPLLPPAGQHLLESLLAWTEKTPAASANGWQKLHAAVTANDDSLWTAYVDDLQRILTYALVKGDGTLVRAWMEQANYPQQFAPLYHAFCAALVGEDHLLSINPEVRTMASRLYQGLARMQTLFLKHRKSNNLSPAKAKKISTIK